MKKWRCDYDGNLISSTLTRRAGNWCYWKDDDDGFEWKTNGERGSETPERALWGLCYRLCITYFDVRGNIEAQAFRDNLTFAAKAFDRASAMVAIEQAKTQQCCSGDGI